MSGGGVVGKNSVRSARHGLAFARSDTANFCEGSWNVKRRRRLDAEPSAVPAVGRFCIRLTAIALEL